MKILYKLNKSIQNNATQVNEKHDKDIEMENTATISSQTTQRTVVISRGILIALQLLQCAKPRQQ